MARVSSFLARGSEEWNTGPRLLILKAQHTSVGGRPVRLHWETETWLAECPVPCALRPHAAAALLLSPSSYGLASPGPGLMHSVHVAQSQILSPFIC